MSTDDLTRRARAAIAGYALYGTPRLVSELADEVDRLGTALRETVAARNTAMRQRDDERRAKEGNIDALNTTVVERDALRVERDGWQTLRNGLQQTVHDLAAERDAARAEAERLRAALSTVNTTVETRTVHDCPLCGSPDDDHARADMPPGVRLPKLVGALSRVLDAASDDGRPHTHQETP